MTDNELTRITIGCCIDIHKELGSGLLESTYKKCLQYDLLEKGLSVEVEKPVALTYKELRIEEGYRLDLLVEGRIVVELKSVVQLTNAHFAQTLTYMKLGNYRLGLLINFYETLLKNGIHRIAN